MNTWKSLVEAIMEEDRLIRERLNACPKDIREKRGSGGELSFKETLSHIAFWDNFTVEFFAHKLDEKCLDPNPMVDFEARSILALERAARLPFGEILARYLEATGALTQFLSKNWEGLTPREHHDFWVPLKHRRHHRISLFRALDEMNPVQEMVAGA